MQLKNSSAMASLFRREMINVTLGRQSLVPRLIASFSLIKVAHAKVSEFFNSILRLRNGDLDRQHSVFILLVITIVQ